MKQKNKIIQKQIDQSFKGLPVLADKFSKTIKDDLYTKPNDILTGVGSINDLDIEELRNLSEYSNYDDITEEHKKSCKKCSINDEICETLEEELGMNDLRWSYFYEGEIDTSDKNNSFKKCSFAIYLDYDSGYYQVIVSPEIEKHGLASLCYLGQADIDAEGDYETYVVPKKYKHNF